MISGESVLITHTNYPHNTAAVLLPVNTTSDLHSNYTNIVQLVKRNYYNPHHQYSQRFILICDTQDTRISVYRA